MQYSPKLKKAMEEIKKIMNDADIGGMVVLHEPGHTEFMNKINPSYSCAEWKRGEGGQPIGAHFKAKAEDFGGDKQQRNLQIANTVNLFSNVITVVGKNWMMWDEMLKSLENKIGKHDSTPGGMSSHETQNN